MFTQEFSTDYVPADMVMPNTATSDLMLCLNDLRRFETSIQRSDLNLDDIPDSILGDLKIWQNKIKDCTSEGDLLLVAKKSDKYIGRSIPGIKVDSIELNRNYMHFIQANFLSIEIWPNQEGVPSLELTFTAPEDAVKDNQLWVVALGSIESVLITRPLLN